MWQTETMDYGDSHKVDCVDEEGAYELANRQARNNALDLNHDGTVYVLFNGQMVDTIRFEYS